MGWMRRVGRVVVALAVFGLGSVQLTIAQVIIPAIEFFNEISAIYEGIEDYVANIAITSDGTTMEGRIQYKAPDLLRIDFTDPKEQVIVSDGKKLMLYLSRQNVTMVQDVRRSSQSDLSAMAVGKGLYLLDRGYSISYLDSPKRVPLDDNSHELVTKLKLQWRRTSEGFRQLIISIGSAGYIRQIHALTKDRRVIVFDLTNIAINQGLSDKSFEFEPPPSSYSMDNFLFSTGE